MSLKNPNGFDEYQRLHVDAHNFSDDPRILSNARMRIGARFFVVCFRHLSPPHLCADRCDLSAQMARFAVVDWICALCLPLGRLGLWIAIMTHHSTRPAGDTED